LVARVAEVSVIILLCFPLWMLVSILQTMVTVRLFGLSEITLYFRRYLIATFFHVITNARDMLCVYRSMYPMYIQN